MTKSRKAEEAKKLHLLASTIESDGGKVMMSLLDDAIAASVDAMVSVTVTEYGAGMALAERQGFTNALRQLRAQLIRAKKDAKRLDKEVQDMLIKDNEAGKGRHAFVITKEERDQ